MLEIKGLTVSANNKKVTDVATLTVKDGEVHLIMGPNGAGKSSLANAIMGHPELTVSGQIIYDGTDITVLPPDKRAVKGLFLAFQHPYEVEGVKVAKFIDKIKKAISRKQQSPDNIMENRKKLEKHLKMLGLSEEFMQRELNAGFSGGEKKRLEIVQMVELEPKFIILDEIDSGLDVDGIKLMAKMIKKMSNGKRSFLIITHYPKILKHLKPDKVHIMVAGKIVESGGSELARKIEKNGYGKYTEKKKEA